MPGSKDPTVQRRRLQVELRRARTEAGLTQKEAAETLDWSPSKLLRIENGTVGISPVDLRALLTQYGIKDPKRIDELVQIARGSKKQPFTEYRDVLKPAFMTYLGFEASAAINRQFQPQLVPGLLQTQEYAEAVLQALDPAISATDIQRQVEARLERQELLDREDAGKFFFIVDEAVVRRVVGGLGVMSRQLELLKERSKQPNVTIQVIPFSAGAHYGMGGPFIVLEFEDPNTDNLLYVENERGDMVSRDATPETTSRLESFWQMEKLASAPEDLNDVLGGILRDMRSSSSSASAPSTASST